jgi:hypothetical protein
MELPPSRTPPAGRRTMKTIELNANFIVDLKAGQTIDIAGDNFLVRDWQANYGGLYDDRQLSSEVVLVEANAYYKAMRLDVLSKYSDDEIIDEFDRRLRLL